MSVTTLPPLDALGRRTAERFEARLATHGPSALALGWGSRDDQLVRFDTLMQAVDLHGRTVLDWGCGFGDLVDHVASRGVVPARYVGVDVAAPFVAEAAARHADVVHASFRTTPAGSVLPHGEAADVVVMLGLCNVHQPDVDTAAYARALLRAGFALAREAVVCDFLSAVPTPGYAREEGMHYPTPQDVLTWGLELSPRVTLHHAHPPIPQREMLLVVRR